MTTKDYQEVPVEILMAEIKRREMLKRKAPPQIDNLDWSRVIKFVEEHVACVEASGKSSVPSPALDIFDNVLTAMYGEKALEWHDKTFGTFPK